MQNMKITMRKLKSIYGLILLVISGYLPVAYALTFNIAPDSDIVGNLQTHTIEGGKSLAEIGRQFNVGAYEMIEANPNLSPWHPLVGAKAIIPTEYVLPPGKRQGLVVNLAEMRIYYYHPNTNMVTTHPIGIGKKGWNTPLGSLHVIQKVVHPHWRPPQSIRADHAKRGDILPAVVPPGPENPLGDYAMRLSIPSYLIHGTNTTGGIGFRSTSGCIRLLPEDIASLYPQIAIGTQVRIIHAPFKFGRRGEHVFVEAHQPLSEHYRAADSTIGMLRQALEAAAMDHINVNLLETQNTIRTPKGYPILVH